MKEKEIKEVFFKIRLTPREKEQLQEYAEKHNLTMSEAVRKLCYIIFDKKEED